MKGLQSSAVRDIFQIAQKSKSETHVSVSFFEIYGGRACDLLNNKNTLNILEDKNNNIQITGLVEQEASDPEELNNIIEYGNSTRTTHATVANDTSSRSHAICSILVKGSLGESLGKIILVDLAVIFEAIAYLSDLFGNVGK
jgi:kinesin family protein 2/24